MSISEYKILVDRYLESCFIPSGHTYDKLLDSMRYSLMAGGKRIRPILALEFARISGGNINEILPIACAIEMLHTYSLIHDDLPCFDNDDLRRGKPTNHIVYGNWLATLAGDALQAEAFNTILKSSLAPDTKCACAQLLGEAAGVNGICSGQYLDMAFEGKPLTSAQLDEINLHKTGILLQASCEIGVTAAGGTEEQRKAAASFGAKIGMAFQIRDDILDVISTESKLGKTIGSDAEEHKNTYMVLLGQEGCEKKIRELTDSAKSSIQEIFQDTKQLESFAEALASRLE